MSGTAEPVQVVVIDDDEMMAELLAEIASEAGFAVRVFNDPVAGLQSVLCEPPKLAILDLMMPVMDGRQVLMALRAQASTAGLPVLMVSASASAPTVLADLLKPPTDFISKPFDPLELKTRIEALCA